MTNETVLAVDLDGTLCRSDTLHEALFHTLATKPGALPAFVAALFKGKIAFKRTVSEITILKAEDLPLNEEVIALVQTAQAAGRQTVLVTATTESQARAIADGLGIFDDVIATGGQDAANVNLGGEAKAAVLVERYGDGGFDYVGNAKIDVPVWKRARRALTVRADAALRRAAEAVKSDVVHLDPPEPATARLGTILRAMRPHQWTKNLLVFVPMLASHDLGVFPAALTAFVAFCLTASSVYVLNDLVDLAADRAHPRKRTRPFAAGEVPITQGIVLAAGLLGSAILISVLFTPPVFLAALGSYFVVTFAYSFWLKRRLVVDIMVLAGLYTARLIGGSAATGVALSPWILGFSMFLFLALAAIKRQAELVDAHVGDGAAPGRAYTSDDLPIVRGIAVSAGHAAVLVLALYITSTDILALYRDPTVLWLLCPILLYWILRMVMVTHRGRMTDDPIVFAATDTVSRILIAAATAVFVVAAIM